ncbi:hypothetical protein [Nitriliruptor alkaliphilus]|uniref:hypothetical protein n=1 Tax=Nitriliruptor alkaliphilus TaxID=427918 RepID=UPI0006989CAB|nr:hypothetical protein [Nitriliruptor alkaliphilus]
MSEILMRDVTRVGRELGRSHLADLPVRATVGDLLETRIRREVAAYNRAPGPVFVGLVQPHDAIRHSDGFRMRSPRLLDGDAAVSAARGAVTAGMLAFQLGDVRVTDLEQVVDVDAHDEILAVLERPVVAAEA